MFRIKGPNMLVLRSRNQRELGDQREHEGRLKDQRPHSALSIQDQVLSIELSRLSMRHCAVWS